ncbi:MAG: DoxX family protein [Candidatus Doudnabacteria bacterium]|nr:DoxX family protein [Candidatus Doudnabacteria bacterium]
MLDFLNHYADTLFWFLQAVIGVIFIVHSFGKIRNPAGIASAYRAPVFVGLVHGLIEALGGLALVLNFHPKTAALVFSVVMLGAIYFKIFKWKTSFMAMNSTGWEFDLILLASCLVIASA